MNSALRVSFCLLCLLFSSLGCGGGGGAAADAPPAELSDEERAERAKKMAEGIAKQREEMEAGAAQRRPGGR